MPEFEPPYTGPSGFTLDHGDPRYVLVRVRVAVPFAPGSLAAFREAIASVFREDRRFIAIDLTDGAVFGPQGYGPLIGAVKACRDRGGDLYLIGASEMVRKVVAHDVRGPVACFKTRAELDRALLGRRPTVEAIGGA